MSSLCIFLVILFSQKLIIPS
uniref:Uncharacterized protein n=1 Tax=Rhizophora mucronata TaxID=61149 RepID=A0A2P2QJY5_RHIMU